MYSNFRHARAGRQSRRGPSQRSAAAKHRHKLELLERRQMLAAQIVGSSTVYATIQAAVDAAVAGQTVTVDPGTYAESVSIFKSITVKGARAGVDGRSNVRGTNESILKGVDVGAGVFSTSFKIGANNVTLDGFTVQGQTTNSDITGAGIVINPNVNGTKILNNVVQNNVAGLYISNNSSTNPLLVEHNVFRFNNNAGQSSGMAIVANGALTGGNITNVIINENFFFKNFGTSNIEPAIAFQTQAANGQSNIRVTGNVFDGNGKAFLAYNATGVTISGNVITTCRDTTSGGLRFEGGNSNITITGNELYASEARAIRIDNKVSSGPNSAFTITGNLIFGNGQGNTTLDGLYVNAGQFAGTINATNNWWGAASGPRGDGPGTGDGIYLNGATGTFTPFATSRLFDGQFPYYGVAQDVGSRMEAENPDHGAEGVSYHDNDSSNSLGRLHYYVGYDVDSSTDIDSASPTGYVLGSTKSGEWLEYAINVPAAGTYTFNGRVLSTSSGAKFHLEVDGVNVSGSVTISSNAAWQTLAKTGINLPGGKHMLRLVFDTNNSSGNVGTWNWFSFTPTSVTLPPTAPSNLVASPGNSTTINLTWADNSNNESGFIIERKLGATGTWSTIKTTASNITSYSDTTVLSASTYFYRISSTGTGGVSGTSSEASATTPAAGSFVYLSDLAWSGTPTNGWGPVEKDKSVGGSLAGDGKVLTLNGVTYTKGLGTHAVANVIYNLAGGYSSFISDIGVDDGTGAGSSVIFQVYTTVGGVETKVFDSGIMGQTTATATVNVSLVGATQLRLSVSDAGDGNGADHADWANARLVLAGGSPNAPSNLVATAAGTNQINLTWTDGSTNETGFILERSLNGTSGWTQIATPAANATSYSDTTGLSSGTQYFYRIRATISGNDSANSPNASATTQSVPTLPNAPTNLAATAFSNTQINLIWTDNSNNELNFILERSPDGVNNWQQIATPAANAVSYSDTTGLVAVTQYFYRIRATNAVGPSTDSNIANATTLPTPTAPAAPSNLAATATSPTQINLTWTDNANNETGFVLERSPNGTTGWTQIATPAANATSFSNTGLTAGTQYYYRIRATNGVGPSTDSNTAVASTFSVSSVNFIAAGSSWKYLDNGSNQGTAWKATSFVETGWKTGNAELGYGDGDEATVVSYGSSSSAKFITTYFRKSFTVADASLVTSLTMKLLRDDGAVVYLNGTEINRSNMPTGTIAYTTRASSSVEDAANTYYTFAISPALLVSGTNVIAVEIHQDSASSSDISFNFQLDGVVNTPANPPAAPTGLGASAVSTSQINLSWTDVANETGFKIERSADGVNGWTQVGTTGAGVTTFSNTGLTQGTQYFYRVRAINGGGDSLPSNIANTTTLLPSPPNAPGNLVATANAAAVSIGLTWADNSSDETGFILERSPDGTSNWTQIATPGQNATSYTDSTGLSQDTQYFYRIRATNAGGPSSNSLVANATTASTPAAPSGLTAAAVSASQINLTWVDASSNETGFVIERSLNGTSGWTQIATPGQNATSYSDSTGLSPVTTYYYRVSAVNALGSSAASGNANDTTQQVPPPPATSSLTATASAGSLQINLAWVDNASNETGFLIERSPDGVGSWVQLTMAGVNATTYSDTTDLVAGTQYFYRVTTVNAGGPGLPSDVASATTATAPAAPGNLVASPLSATQIGLAWTDNSSNESGVVIERSLDGINNWTLVTTTAANATSYTDGSRTAATTYYYRVRATNAIGSSDNTDVASATTLAVPPPNAPSNLAAAALAGSLQINLSWTDNANNETGFIVERSLDGVNDWTQVGTPGANATSFNDTTGLVAGTTYYYRVSATGASGPSAPSASANATTATAPNAPSNFSAVNFSASQINLAWTDNATNETGFVVERSLDGTTGWTQVGTPGANTVAFSDTTGLSANTAYYYRVKAVNGIGSSAYTAVASATTSPSNGLPSPFVNADIGTTGAAGSATYSNGVYTVKGSGADIWSTADSFHFVNQQMTGNFSIVARVTSMQNTKSWAKAGIMIRNTLAANSAEATVFTTPTDGIGFVTRTTAGASSSLTSTTGAAPYWLKLTRSGNTITSYKSTNGTTWTQVGTVSITMNATVYVGLAVCSKVAGTLNTATFDNVSIA